MEMLNFTLQENRRACLLASFRRQLKYRATSAACASGSGFWPMAQLHLTHCLIDQPNDVGRRPIYELTSTTRAKKSLDPHRNHLGRNLNLIYAGLSAPPYHHPPLLSRI